MKYAEGLQTFASSCSATEFPAAQFQKMGNPLEPPARWADRLAGAAREHPAVLVIGLVLSVILMGAASNVIAKYIERYRWIAWIGLLVILWVAAKMIWDGWHDVHPHIINFIGR